jgi:hypothetical protein
VALVREAKLLVFAERTTENSSYQEYAQVLHVPLLPGQVVSQQED